MMLAIRPEYAVAVADVVSATTLNWVSVESSNTTLRPTMSLTSRRPFGSARTPTMLFHATLLFAAIAPIGRIAGCCWAATRLGRRVKTVVMIFICGHPHGREERKARDRKSTRL